MHKLDIVIPLYNSNSIIVKLIDRLNEWKSTIDYEFKVIFVEDGSSEISKEIVYSSEKKFDFQYIQLLKNYGQHTATAIGLGKSTAPLIATLDDDLQHDPFEINKLIDHLEKSNSDLVFGTFVKKNHSILRNLGSKLLKLIFSFEKIDYSSITAFRIMRPNVIQGFKNNRKPIVFIEEYLLRNANNKTTCLINHSKREEGTSGYSYWKLFNFALKIIVFHSSLLLKLIVRFGIFTSLICFGMVCYFIWKKWMFGAYIGFSAIIVSIFFSTGVLLITLGIIGEYIRRIWVDQNQLDLVMIKEGVE